MTKPTLIGGIFITVKELQHLAGLSYSGALKLHRAIRDCMGKTGKYMTVNDFCDYTESRYETVVNYLNTLRLKIG